MRNIFDEIVETLKYRQREEEIFVNVNRDDDFYRAMHETRIGALGGIKTVESKTEHSI